MSSISTGRPIYLLFSRNGDERFDGLDRAVRVELDDDDVATELLAAVPRAVTRNEDRVVVFLREHGAGVKAHSQRCRVRSQPRDRRGELIAAVAPTELRVEDIATAAMGKAEIVLPEVSQPVEFVLGKILGQPVALVFGKIELLQHRVPVHADDLACAARHDLRPTAVEIDAANLRVGRAAACRHCRARRC